jgi:photosystem II stability/assembly factor-like uncharacterized protein
MKKILILALLMYMSGAIDAQPLSTSKDPNLKYYENAIEWRSIGPFRGGRSCAVTGVPGKPNLFYFGATGGGVWKTNDGGRSWDNISDGYFGGSIGAIAVAPSDHNVLYVGGGEQTVRGNVSSGYGMYKSEDAGKTWKSVGLTDSRHIGRIRVHPTNSNVVYVAAMGNLYKDNAERGIFKTTDGGITWNKVLFINNSVGFVDLCLDPNNPRIMYASSWKINRTPYSLNSGGEGSGLWKSTDSGATWIEITGNKGLPKGVWGINGVAVSPVNSERVYALIENKDGGIYVSDDAGETWTKRNDDRSLRQRAWYYTRIYADTEDENTLYVMNVSYHKSTDGGRTFQRSNAPHGDHHDLWIAPEDPKRMVIADDGGAQVSYDGGETWSTYHNQPTAQFYRVVTDNHFPYRIYAAQQDNSTVRIAHRTQGGSIGEDDWESTAGGESAHIAVDPENSDIVYGGSYGGFLTRVNHDKGTVRGINVWPDNPMGYGAEGMKYRFQWNFPIFFSKHNPDVLYTASNHLHMSTNEGQSWEIISPDLTRNDPEKLKSSGGPITQDNTGVEYYCTIFAAGESPIQQGLLWVGSDDGLVHVSSDGGKNWSNVTPPNMPEWIMINSVEPSAHDVNTCYIAATMYKHGDFQPYLYKTTDMGKTWRKITNGIPNEHFTRVVREDPNKKGLLYAGTEIAMYVSYNDGMQWYPLQLNLPIVPITDLAVKNNNLIAATQGRSLWMIDDLTVLHQVMDGMTANKEHLYKPMDSYRMGGFQRSNPQGEGLNHPGGVMTNFYVGDYDMKKDTISLTYKDAMGKAIKTFSTHAKERGDKIEVKEGANMFSWNMSYPDAKRFDGMIFWAGSLAGPKAVPGDYTVTLNRNGKEYVQPFKILISPNSESTLADIQKQFDFVMSVNDKVTEAHQAIIDMRSLKGQIKTYTSMIDDKDIKDYASQMDSIMNVVENELYQTKNRSGQDPLNFPIKLTNKLAHLNSMTQMRTSDFPPTDQAFAVRDEMVGKIDVQLAEFKKVKEVMVPQLNNMIRDKALDVIIIKEE